MRQHDTRSDQRLFLRTVELGAIRSVARETGAEPSSVSRRLTALEARLGAKLLDRAQGRTRPTEAGMRYYEGLRALVAQMDALEADVAGEADRPRGLLRVNATIDFGQRFVARWLFDFRALHPEVEVELALSARNVDLTATGTDIAIRVGELPDSSLVARRLATVPRVLAGAPDYLRRAGWPETPADLARLDHVFFLPENRHTPLRLTGPDGTRHEIARKGGVTVNAVTSVVEAVRAGFGISSGPRWAFHEALAAGDVVELLPDFTHEAPPLSAVRAPSVIVPARIRAFTEFAAGAVRAVPGLAF